MSDERPILRYTVHGPPVPKARPRLGRGGKVFTPERTKQYEEHAATVARAALSHLRGWRTDWASYAMTVRIFRESAVGDCDNHVKAHCDSLNGVAYLDDCAVTEIHATMVDDPARPRVEIEVRMLGDVPRNLPKPRKRAPRPKMGAPAVLKVPSMAALLGVGKVKRRRKRR